MRMKIPNIEQPVPSSASTPTATATPDYLEEDVDFGEYTAVVVDNKWSILLITVLVSLVGSTYAYLAQPIYKTNTLLQVEKQKSSALGALDDLAASFEGDSSTAAEIEILRSRSVVGAAVTVLSLDIIAAPIHFPMIGAGIARRFGNKEDAVAQPWFGLSKYAWGGENISLETLQVPPNILNKSMILVAGHSGSYRVFDSQDQLLLQGLVGQRAEKAWPNGDTIRIFVSALKARPGTHFKLVHLSLQQATNRILADFSITEKGKQTGILEVAYKGSDRTQITKILNEITNIYVRQNVEGNSEEAKKSLAFLDKQLPPLKHQVDVAEANYNDYRIRHGSIDMTYEARIVLENNVSVDAQIMGLKQHRSELRQRFKATHPLVRAVDSKIVVLDKQQKTLSKKSEKLPVTQQEILRLARAAQSSAALYSTLLNTAQQLRVAQASTVGDVRIIDFALNPDRAIKPQRGVIVFISIVGGVFLGMVIAFVRRAMNNGVEDPDELERQLGLPVYASVLHSDKQSKAGSSGVLAHGSPSDPAIESLRSLQTTLHFTQMAAKNNIILVTGPSPGVGKTFVSINLAAVFAKNGKTTCVIDADMRRGTGQNYLGISRKNGLSEMIIGSVSDPIKLNDTGIDGFQLITTGELPPNPTELLLHDSFGKRLEQLSQMFDYIIIDAPPVLAVTDPAIIARHAGITLLVCNAGRHPMRELDQTVKRLQQAGIQVNGWVFNNLDVTSSRAKYSKYVYHYDYA